MAAHVAIRDSRARYNFSPFLSAPAVRDVARKDGQITTVNIPPTTCPSPLAPNISPEQLTNLKNHLVGPHTGQRGREIWLSWKRAWDLWNNHYIEGRINPEWIKKEWDRRAKEVQEKGPRRRRYGNTRLPTPRPEPKILVEEFIGSDPPEAKPGTKWIKLRNDKSKVVTGRKLSRWETTTVAKKVLRAKPGQHAGQSSKAIRKPILKFVPVMEPHVEEVFFRKDSYYPIRPWSTDAKVRQKTGKVFRSAGGKNDDGIDKNIKPEPTEFVKVSRTVMKEKLQLKTYTVREPRKPDKLIGWDELQRKRRYKYLGLTSEGKEEEEGSEEEEEEDEDDDFGLSTDPLRDDDTDYVDVQRTIWEPVGSWEESDEYEYIPAGPAKEIENEEVTEEAEVEVEVSYDEVLESSTPVWQQVEDFDDPRPKPKKAKRKDPVDLHGAPGAPASPPQSLDLDMDDEPESSIELDQDDDHFFVDIVEESDSEDEDAWIPHTEEEDGSSGGYYAMKDLPEYQEYPGEEWNDILTNTVWRPRHVGEKTLKIDMDDDFNDLLDDNQLTVDGGVDCGKSPYPVLRSVDNYIELPFMGVGAYKKKRVWDGVTGTIFNMPTKALEPDSDPVDGKLAIIKALYTDFTIDDPLAHQTDIFPLDIRRVEQVNNFDVCNIEEPPGGQLVRYSWDNPIKEYRPMETFDPWYVTMDQETKRDVPPRRYPPREPAYEGGELIPLDDVNWIQNRVMDELGDTQYFVTNLHGGTLIINGQEIKTGQVAGPLPSFAVIETPGGQVSFWWGVRGKNWNQASQPSRARDWEILRNIPGWKHAGLKAGAVWDQKIQDRIKREAEGEDEEDDALWKSWKNPRIQQSDLDKMTDAEYGAYHGTDYIDDDYVVATDEGLDNPGPQKEVPPPTIFDSEEEELKWIAVKSQALNLKATEIISSGLIEPEGRKFWPGTVSQEDALPFGHITEASLEEQWNREGPRVIQLQKAVLPTVAKMEAEGKTQILECRKRRRGDDLNSQERVKRNKAELDTELERLKAEQEVDDNEAKAAASNDESNRLAARRLRERELRVTALVQEGVPKQEAERRFDDAENAHREKLDDLNKQRHREGKPPIPGRQPLTVADIASSDADRKKLDKINAEEAARRLQDENEKADKINKELQQQYKIDLVETVKEKNEFANAMNAMKQEEEEKVKVKQEKDIKKGSFLGSSGKIKVDKNDQGKLSTAQSWFDTLDQTTQDEIFAAGNTIEEAHLEHLKQQQIAMWVEVESKGGKVTMDLLSSEHQTWYAEHMAALEQFKRLLPKTTEEEIMANLNARADTAGLTPAEYVRQNSGIQGKVYANVDEYVAATVKAIKEMNRIPNEVARRDWEFGMAARATLTGKTKENLAKEAGFTSARAMRENAIDKLGNRWSFKRLPPTFVPASHPDRKDYEEALKIHFQRQAEDVRVWVMLNEIVLTEIGDFEADCEVVDRMREDIDNIPRAEFIDL